MLTAKTDTGKLVTLIQTDRDKINGWKATVFSCPICYQHVRLKIGKIRIPHFAHLSNQSCVYSGEQETEEHLWLKRTLAEWCLRSKIDYQLEVYLPDLKQRPDILIGHLAVEIQCSILAPEKMLKRTLTYIKHGYQPIWICGTKLWNPERLKDSTKQFCNYTKELGFHIWSADWKKEKLAFHYHLEEDSEKHLYYGSRSWSFFYGNLGELLQGNFGAPLLHYRRYQLKLEMSKNYRTITRKLIAKDRNIMNEQAYFYERYLHLLELHPWFYYTINQTFIFKAPAFILRHRIWEYLLKAKLQKISKLDIYKAVYELIIKQDILYDFPLVFKGDLIEWYVCYLIESLMTFDLLKQEPYSADFFTVTENVNSLSVKSKTPFKKLGTGRVIKTGTPLKI
ncbi:hypothetical protein LI951_13125 [Enterococcus sp. BWT-B8]|uniref:competence protein CoiA n=1 Tax=Enterococcus sp. BWT-B8 TaxID=2885157 RepID=UPI001E4C26CF|nr:competence protein CoiA family protein [Enterococcus sp. BWT-B8]MCB5953012.1 hypothetical protein [Enterococcus sp. BWT-B8]